MRSAPPLSSSAVPMIEAIAMSSPICPHVRPNPSPTRSPAGVRARAAASCAESPRARAACSTTPAGVSKVTSRAAPSNARNAWMRRNRIPPTTRASASRNRSRTSTGRHARAVRPGCQGQSMHNAQGHKGTRAQGTRHRAQGTRHGRKARRRHKARCAMHNAHGAGDGRGAAGGQADGRTETGDALRRCGAGTSVPADRESRSRWSFTAVDRAPCSARLQSTGGGCDAAMR